MRCENYNRYTLKFKTYKALFAKTRKIEIKIDKYLDARLDRFLDHGAVGIIIGVRIFVTLGSG